MLESNSQLGKGGAGFHGTGTGTAAAMLKELQGLTRTLVDGAAADTNIPITGIAAEDTLVSVIEWNAGVPTDRTADASITSAGNIQLSTTNSTGNKLDVLWFNKQ